MTIIHDNITLPPDGGAVIFAQLGGFTCSVCAPSTMGKEAVEAFATRELGEPMGQVDDRSRRVDCKPHRLPTKK
jgi:hypothetical protein